MKIRIIEVKTGFKSIFYVEEKIFLSPFIPIRCWFRIKIFDNLPDANEFALRYSSPIKNIYHQITEIYNCDTCNCVVGSPCRKEYPSVVYVDKIDETGKRWRSIAIGGTKLC